MTNLLIRLFIGKNYNAKEESTRGKFALLASIVGIAVNVLLFGLKIALGILIASVAIVADAFNNISDAGSVLIAFIGFRLAAKPVDKEHPLGHGRFEYISGFIVDMLIILVGFELLISSIDKIQNPTLPSAGTITFILLGVAVLGKLWLFFFYKKIATIISSTPLKGSAMDSISDCFATIVVLISTLVGSIFHLSIDGYAGILVSAFIIFAGVKAAKETIDLLLGTPPSEEFIGEIYTLALSHKEVLGIHDLLVHDYGPGRQFVSFHAEVSADADITQTHDVIDLIEQEMEEKFKAIVTIHMDPLETNNQLVNEMKSFVLSTVKEVDPTYHLHDFRMTYGGKHVNVIFDLCIPTDSKLSKEEAGKVVKREIESKRENLFAVIKVEHPYV